MRRIGIVFGLMACAGCATTGDNPWNEAKRPTQGSPEIIGTYSAGCLAGAVAPQPDGPGFQLMRLSRGKFYGHPALIAFIEDLGRRVSRKKLGQVLVGNLSMARGGPTLVGHKSHQTGLDVDIWFWQPQRSSSQAAPRRLSLLERETLHAPSCVAPGGMELKRDVWSSGMAAVLRVTAEHESVERIFVHPTIKRELCEASPGVAWLAKIRPWWGHDDHFHVRLKCPADQAGCVRQASAPLGDGCGVELDWWFSDEARQAAERARTEPEERVMPKLPEGCARVLNAN